MAKFRFRSTSGKLYDIQNVAVIEVCNDADELSGIVFMDDNMGSVTLAIPGDEEYGRYVKLYKSKKTTASVLYKVQGAADK